MICGMHLSDIYLVIDEGMFGHLNMAAFIKRKKAVTAVVLAITMKK